MKPSFPEAIQNIVCKSIESGSGIIILDCKENGSEWTIFLSDNGKGNGYLFIKNTYENKFRNFEIDFKQDEGLSLCFQTDSANDISLPDLFSGLLSLEGRHELVINRYAGNTKYTLFRSEFQKKKDSQYKEEIKEMEERLISREKREVLNG